MPHAALWVVQQYDEVQGSYIMYVSMPHAALWVVQLTIIVGSTMGNHRFNAARGFVGGAA